VVDLVTDIEKSTITDEGTAAPAAHGEGLRGGTPGCPEPGDGSDSAALLEICTGQKGTPEVRSGSHTWTISGGHFLATEMEVQVLCPQEASVSYTCVLTTVLDR
jgi:hypothetical protein